MQTSIRHLGRLCTACGVASRHALTAPTRTLSTLQLEDEETQWRHQQEGRYGEGNYTLFRALYKEVCDEVRREFFTKPPPPFTAHLDRGNPNATYSQEVDSHRTEDTSNGAGADSTEVRAPRQPNVTYGDGRWHTEYRPENNVILFHRDAVKSSRMARVVAYARVAVEDPPRLNAMLTFADWYPFEILIERKGVVVHYSVACNEGGMHMRNCRVYEADALSRLQGQDTATAAPSATVPSSSGDASREGEPVVNSAEDDGSAHTRDAVDTHAIVGITDDAEWVRQNLLYDGPCLWHLELSFQNELYDVMQDHGIDLDWLRWASEWVFYYEHVLYTRWCVGVLDNLIPADARGGEEDFLLPREQELLDEPAEDWLAPHAM